MLVTEFGAGQIPAISRPPAIGRVFYVHNWTGNDNNNGVDPSTPFATITYALTQCLDDRNDYIIVLQHYQELPITVNVDWVHIIGVTANPALPFICLNNAANNDSIFYLVSTGNHAEIAGFMLGGGAAHAGIENAASTPQQPYIHNCYFGNPFSGNTPQDGILIAAGLSGPVIEHCTFMGDQVNCGGLITRDGIRLQVGAISGGLIRNCTFLGLDGVGIHILAAFVGGVIKDNVFAVPDAAAHEAIDIAAGAGGTLIDGNHATEGMAAMGNVPYGDATAGGNHWSNNTQGIAGAINPT